MQRGPLTVKPWRWTPSEYKGVSTAISESFQPSASSCCQGCLMGFDDLFEHQVHHKELSEFLAKDKKDLATQRDELNQTMSTAEKDHLTVQLLLKECDFVYPTVIVPKNAFQKFNKMALYDVDRSRCRNLIEVERQKIISLRQNLKGQDRILTAQERMPVLQKNIAYKYPDDMDASEVVEMYPPFPPPEPGQDTVLTTQERSRPGLVRKYPSLELGRLGQQAYGQSWQDGVASKFAEKNTPPELDRQNQEHHMTRQDFGGNNNSFAAQRKMSVVVVSIIGFILFLLVRFFPAAVQSNPQQQRNRYFDRQ